MDGENKNRVLILYPVFTCITYLLEFELISIIKALDTTFKK